MRDVERAARRLVVADDTTGALDSALGFLGVGTVEYRVAGAADASDADVLAISTGSRASAVHDGTAVTRAVETALADAAARVFVKVDSTLRGWPAEHLRAVRAALHHRATAVVCPAAPGLGRTVEGGRVLVHGVPALESPAAQDPVAPLREDRLPTLFDAPVVAATDLPALAATHDTVVVDASTAEELDALARVIESLGPRVLPVGSAGLAAALGALQRPAGTSPDAEVPRAARGLVLVTSAHPVARQQVAAAHGRWPVVAPPPMEVARVDHDTALDMARRTADAAADLVGDGTDAIVVIGGDGTDAVLRSLGASGVRLLGSLAQGIPWGRVRGGPRDGLLIATKSGGFGGPDALDRVITALTKEP